MAEQQIPLVPYGARDDVARLYPITLGSTSRVTGGVTYQHGTSRLDGPVVLKTAARHSDAAVRIERELDVARYLQSRGGERLSKCIGHATTDSSIQAIVTQRGRPMDALVRDEGNWPPGYDVRMKIIVDLLQSVELLRVSSIVHGAIGLNTLHWDGDTLQLVDFGGAALCGEYPDGRTAHHGDDILAAGRVIYQVHTGQRAPDDDAETRKQIQQVHGDTLGTLLLRRDLVNEIDIDYVFAPEPGMRPTSRVLLDRIDRRQPRITPARMVAEESATRAEFRQLRSMQAQARHRLAGAELERRRRPPRGPGSDPRTDPTAVALVGWTRTAVLTLIIAVVLVVALLLVGVLR